MRKLLINFLIGTLVLFGLITLIGSLLFAFGVITFGVNLVTALFFVTEFLLLAAFGYVIYLYRKFKQKELEQKQKEIAKQKREDQLLNLYTTFGIRPQYREDGTLKNFYELLGIEPQYDEFGERIPTIYELLQILPRFDGEGNEIPTVVFIKNNLSRSAKLVPATLGHFTEKLSKERQEELAKQNQQVSEKKIAVLAGKKQSAKKAAPLKPMPPRKQKIASLKTSGSKASASSLSLEGIFGRMFDTSDLPSKPKIEKEEDEKPQPQPAPQPVPKAPTVEAKPQPEKKEPEKEQEKDDRFVKIGFVPIFENESDFVMQESGEQSMGLEININQSINMTEFGPGKEETADHGREQGV